LYINDEYRERIGVLCSTPDLVLRVWEELAKNFRA